MKKIWFFLLLYIYIVVFFCIIQAVHIMMVMAMVWDHTVGILLIHVHAA